MTRLFIHIGFHRTGTTALQNYLWANRPHLASQGVDYPAVALSGPTHGKLANVFKGEAFKAALTKMRPWPGPEEYDPYRLGEDEDAETLYGSLREAIAQSGLATTVLSSECFLEWIEPARVAEHILPWNADTKIVVYLRRQDLWIQSVYNQVIKDRFLRYHGSFADMPQHGQLDYRSILDQWAAAFGQENIIVRVYEKEQLKDGDVVSDFLSIIGPLARASEAGEDREKRGARANSSLHREIVSMLEKTNALQLGDTEHRLILEALRSLNDPLVEADESESFEILDPEQRRAIVERYEEGNREIARTYLAREDGVLFTQGATAD